jgi:hypothetical protein
MKFRKTTTFLLIVFFGVAFVSSLSPFLIGRPDNSLEDGLNDNTNLPSVDTTWRKGETVKTKIDFVKETFWFDDWTIYGKPSSLIYDQRASLYDNAFSDDGIYCNSYVHFDPPDTTYYLECRGEIYAGGKGTLYIRDMFAKATDNATPIMGSISTPEEDYTIDIDSANLSAEGYLRFTFCIMATSTSVNLLAYYTTEDGYTLIRTGATAGSIANVEKIYFYFDAFYFQRDSIENNILSEYQYSSDRLITHRMVIPSVPHAKWIEIFTPIEWDYASCTPVAIISYSGATQNHKILSPEELSYEIMFYSSREDFQALVDISSTLLADVGFERFTLDDLAGTSYAPSETVISANTSSEGFYSLYMTNNKVVDSYWTHRKTVTISNDYAECSNFVAYIKVTYESEMQTDFDDIRFYTTGDVALDFELESKTDSTEAYYWVNIGTASAGNNQIYMYYGNDDASSGSDSEDTWAGTPFFMVQHFNELSGTVYDSTSNSIDMTSSSVDMEDVGVVGNGYDFDGSSSYLYSASSTVYTSLSTFTIMFFAEYDFIANLGFTSRDDQLMRFWGTSHGTEDEFHIWSNDSTVDYNKGYNGDSWTAYDLITYQYDGTNINYWVNDAQIDTDVHGNINIGGSSAVKVGVSEDNLGTNRYFNGSMDEFRVAKSDIDDDYIKLTYDLVKNQATEVTFSSATEGEYQTSYTEGNAEVGYDLDYNGEICGYFDYYLVDGITISNVTYGYYDFDTWYNTTFSSTDDLLEDRWIRHFFNFTLVGTDSVNGRNFFVQYGLVNGTFYLDNINFFKVSTKVDTTGYNELTVKVPFINRDGYNNPIASYKSVTIQIVDRTSKSLLETVNVTTSVDGIAETVFYLTLSMREYLVYAYVWDSAVRSPVLVKSAGIIIDDDDGDIIYDTRSTGDQDYYILPSAFTDPLSYWTNEGNAYDINNSTYADTTISDDANDLELNTFNNSGSGETIDSVDIYIRCDWAITDNDICTVKWFVEGVQGSGTFEMNVGNSQSNYVISFEDVAEPNDASWSWTDVEAIEIVFDIDRSQGDDITYIYIDEVWGWLDVTAVSDTTNPDINSPSDFTREYPSTGHTVNWTVGDVNPNKYEIWRNDSIVESGSWTNGTIDYSLLNLGIGVYNFTAFVNDTTGNSATDMIWVTIQDTTDPVCDSPSDDSYQLGSTGNTITWTVTELLPDKYEVFRNDTSHASGSYINGVGIEIDIDGLSVGVYNFTIYVNDTSGNSDTDLVWITVTDVSDTTNPLIDSPADDTIEFGSTTDDIQWNGTDANPDTYIVYRNDSNIQSGSWTNDTFITVELDGLALGIYNFTCWINDTSNNFVTDIVWITVSDTTDPTTDSPADDSYELGSTGNTIVWTVSDLLNDTYVVWRNGTSIQDGSYTSGSVTVDIDGLSVGLYNFTLYLNDTSGNSVTDIVWITVQDTSNPSIDSPSDDSYEYDVGTSITWTVSDLQNDTYVIWRNGSSIQSGSYASGSVLVTISGLGLGIYNFTCYVNDTDSNSATDTVWITVQDTTDPVTDSPSDDSYEYDVGTSITWTVSDLLNDTYIVYRNDSNIQSGIYSSGSVLVTISGLGLGVYNFTLWLNDTSGNTVTDIVWITVSDTTDPTTDSPSDDSYEYDVGTSITWTVSDLLNDTYIVYRNDSNIQSGTYTSGSVLVSISGLGIGVYNFTLWLNDTSGNTVTDTVWITVQDTTDPVTDSPSDDTIEFGSTSDDITWTVSDLLNDTYCVWRNDTNVQNGSYTSGSVLYELDSLTVGVWNITLFLNDTSGNSVIDIVWITVSDTTAPVISDLEHDPTTPSPIDVVSVDCSISDLSTIENGTLFWRIDGGGWNSGLMSEVSGDYNYTLGTFNDGELVEYYVKSWDIYDNWVISSTLNFTCISVNPAPDIENVSHSPTDINETETTTIRCQVNDTDGVSIVILYYKYAWETSWTSVTMNNETGTTWYNYTVGVFYAGVDVQYYIWANDTVGGSSTSSTYHIYTECKYFGYYFTPMDADSVEVDDDDNLVDFSEYTESGNETTRDVASIFGYSSTTTINVTSGYIEWISNTSTSTYTNFAFSETIDSSFYDHVYLRVWCNVTGVDIYFRYYSTTFALSDMSTSTVADEWVVATKDMSSISAWSVFTGAGVGVYLSKSAVSVEVKVDYIRLGHVEDSEMYSTGSSLVSSSENEIWECEVFSDDNSIGKYTDSFEIVYNTTTVYNHNITVVPFDRTNESNKCYIHTNTYEHLYNSSESQTWRSVKFSFTSSVDGETINPLIYLDIYLNNELVGGYGTDTYLSTFNITIYDKLGQLLTQEIDYSYEALISLQLPLREITVSNSYSTVVSFRLLMDGYSGILEDAVGGESNTTVYLKDGTYIFEYKATDEKISETEYYKRTGVEETTSVSSVEVDVYLDRFELPYGGGVGVFNDRNITVIMISGFLLILVLNTLQKSGVGKKLANQFGKDKGLTQEDKDRVRLKKIEESVVKKDKLKEYVEKLERKDEKKYRRKL